MRLEICVATMEADGASGSPWPGNIATWTAMCRHPVQVYVHRNTPERNLGVVASYQRLYEMSSGDVLAYIHDDVTCREEGWNDRVLREFKDPKVGVVGFGGALAHGADDLYKVPYQLHQLARMNYYSNVDDAENHGKRTETSFDVAVVDGFALCVRRSLLDRCGGWHPGHWPPHHLYDYVFCATAHRYRFTVRVLGIRCHHHGGRTATSSQYQDWAKATEWGSDAMMHEKGHRMFYDEFRDVLPWRCYFERKG